MSTFSPDSPDVSWNWPHFAHWYCCWLVGVNSHGLMSALGKPLSMPVHTDMMESPANTRLRKTSSSDGLVNMSTPIFFQESRTSCSTSVSSVLSPAVSTMMIIGSPLGSRRMLL